MKYLRRLFLAIILTTFMASCSGVESSWSCFGASTPTSFTMDNDGQTTKSVTLYKHNNQLGFDRVGTLEITANSEKTICLEGEGTIEKGLYIYENGTLHKVYLKQLESQRLKFSETAFRIAIPKQLKDLIDQES
ncbi:hypothetical protein [Echinicola sp. 20G]|uniref:hypothetical protein n=1 Tax=Echinicola sp. 20G TaxID=2781961 RepID=UPI00191092A1|nr:hypothetical protein [Echinicola sp. 20G]